MPAQHKIDRDTKLITTIWYGEAAENELVDALSQYQRDIKSQPDYCSYDEILDFSNASGFTLSTEGIIKLAHIAARTDANAVRTKLAIIVNQPLAFGLGRMYAAYRGLMPGVFKDVCVFRNYGDAHDWITNNADYL